MVSTPNDLITQVRLPSGAKMITALSLIAVVGLAGILINVGRDAEKPTLGTPTQVTLTPETPAATTAAAPTTPAKADDRNVAVSADPAGKPPVLAALTAEKAPAATPTPAVVSGAPAHEVVIEGKERTWMKVVLDDADPQEIFLGEGKTATYTALNKIKVVLGNSTGSRVLYNGKEVEGKQFMGTIRSYKFPANAKFPQDVPSQRPAASQAPPVTE
jgi:hypothetical protein